jgi:hypothetical protein
MSLLRDEMAHTVLTGPQHPGREVTGTYSLTRECRVEKASGWMDRMAFQLRSLQAESI